jgi:hypothetical protein
MLSLKPIPGGYIIQLPGSGGAERLSAWKADVVEALRGELRGLLSGNDHFLEAPEGADPQLASACAALYAAQMKAVAKNIYVRVGEGFHWVTGVGPDRAVRAAWEGVSTGVETPGMRAWRAMCTASSCAHAWEQVSELPPVLCPRCGGGEIVYKEVKR